MKDPKVIVALDYDEQSKALDFVSKVNPELCKLKVGNELFTTAGQQFVSKLVDKGFKSSEAIEIVETMISSGIINERRPSVSYPGRYSSYYRR